MHKFNRKGGIRLAKQYAELQQIQGKHWITKETDYEFLYHLQMGLLLALQEQGWLKTAQYIQAEERLQQQRKDRAKKIREAEAKK